MFRAYVEKKDEFAIEAKALIYDLKYNLGIYSLKALKILNRYDIDGINEEEYKSARDTIFSEPPVDRVYDEEYDFSKADRFFITEYLPGQFDQRADSAAQCIQILTQKDKPLVKNAKVIVLFGDISQDEFTRIKEYYINPVEMREAEVGKPKKLEFELVLPSKIEVLHGLMNMGNEELSELRNSLGLAMSLEDFQFCQEYFKKENRDATYTEIKVIDTYWSDHCRHTTFNTILDNIQIEEGTYSNIIETAFQQYIKSREFVYADKEKAISLMDMATISMKSLRKQGKLQDLEESDEINACSIIVEADIDGKKEEWLVMFKNETHNHPTEIEPFGGAATCLGGAIRDPLSGRAYVFGAMRVTGSADPRKPIEETLSGKLSQRKITTGAAAGYSSYGNQIGLATGKVVEIYDEDFVAKRMEIGAVVAAAPRANVIRKSAEVGDIVILLGGRTGRDGCGGATGSSKEHDEESIFNCGAEVQKGNPPTERKIQRLFRKPEVTKMIKKCNDFGAGGVAVAVGELADSLLIDLDAVPKKYEGLDATELAISESQERMAVVVSLDDKEEFLKAAAIENIEAAQIAEVTDNGRLTILWNGIRVADLARDFLNTNGLRQKADVMVKAPKKENAYFECFTENNPILDIEKRWLANLSDLNVCSQKGLVERFDSTIGAGTILMPLGGKYQNTPQEGLAMKLPVLQGDTDTAVLMSYGYDPKLSKWSPFHGAMYSIVEASSKIVALGGGYKDIRLTLQEYFEKLGKDSTKWGKPFSALLGACYAQEKLGIAAIGGKDSMSGTFKDLNVPPTLVAFALAIADAEKVISREFKKDNSKVVLLPVKVLEDGSLDFDILKDNFDHVSKLIIRGDVLSSSAVAMGGIAAAVSEMCFGNMIGFNFEKGINPDELFIPKYGSIILEVSEDADLSDIPHLVLGHTASTRMIEIKDKYINLRVAYEAWTTPLEKIFPTKAEDLKGNIDIPLYTSKGYKKPSGKIGKPRVLIPVFPGTNCEYDTRKAFEKAGAQVNNLVIRNNSTKDIEESIEELRREIQSSQIIALSGGFSGGDEPDGSGKFMATAFRNAKVKEAVMELIKNRDGLIIGICNGFQVLIKLGLLPYGEIMDMNENSPTLTYNKIGKHMSCMVKTKVVSTLSPWLSKVKAGDTHTIAISHGEGRFVANDQVIQNLIKNGQVATQYVDFNNNATYDINFNPNGSTYAIEAITSIDGRIFGKMGHSERIGKGVCSNIAGVKDQKIFEAGVGYFS